jgi:hypothetical protein
MHLYCLCLYCPSLWVVSLSVFLLEIYNKGLHLTSNYSTRNRLQYLPIEIQILLFWHVLRYQVQGLHWLKDLLSFLKSIFPTGIQIKKPPTKMDNISIDSTKFEVRCSPLFCCYLLNCWQQLFKVSFDEKRLWRYKRGNQKT